jgi:hypothetical protein
MPTEQNKRLSHPFIEEVGTLGNLAAGDERCAEVEQESLARTLFRLALTLATEPPKLGQQMLSFKGGTSASLLQDIEDLYQHQQISGRVYVKAKLLLRTADHLDVLN